MPKMHKVPKMKKNRIISQGAVEPDPFSRYPGKRAAFHFSSTSLFERDAGAKGWPGKKLG
jgi:hypothetical protein